MDQAFFVRAKRLLEQREPARLDHVMLVAAVKAQQAASATASAAARRGAARAWAGGDQQAITALILAEQGWPEACESQRGCFSRAVAAHRVNRP